MELHPVTHVVLVDEAIGVAPKPVHMAIAARNSPVAHHNGNLMQRFGKQGPEIPVVIGTSEVRFRVAFYGVIQIWELHGVPEKENLLMVSDPVSNSFVGVEFQRKPADI